MQQVIESLKAESAALRVRLAIFTAAESALRKHAGKPIGKRLANDAKALIQASCGEKAHAWTVGGPNDWRYLWIRAEGTTESFMFGWKAAEVRAETVDEVAGWRDSLAARVETLEGLLADPATLETLVNNCRLDLQDLQNAAERVKLSKKRLPDSAFKSVLAEFPAISDLTNRIY